MRIPLYVSAAGTLFVIAIGFTIALRILSRAPGRTYVREWALTWGSLAVYAVASGMSLIAVNVPALAGARMGFSLLSIAAAWVHLRTLGTGMRDLCAPGEALPRWREWSIAMLVVAALLIVLLPQRPATSGPVPMYLVRVILLALAWGIAYGSAAWLVFRRYTTSYGIGRNTLAMSLALYGLLRILEPLSHLVGPAPILAQLLTFGGLPLLVGIGVGMLVVLLEVERDRVIEAVEAKADAERTAKGSEARLATALASSTDPVLIVDAAGRLAAFNARFAAILLQARGLHAEIGTPVASFVKAEAFPEWPEIFATALAGQSVVRTVRLTIGPEGPQTFIVRATPVIESGATIGVLVVTHDSTEEDRLRDALARREEWFRSMIENANDIILQVSVDGRVEYVSPSITRMLGIEPANLIGHDAFTMVHPDDIAMMRDSMQQSFAMDPDSPSTVALRARSETGEWVHLEAVSRPHSEADGTPRLIVALRDVRERRRLEAELMSARRLESVGRLAGGVAHDFNNLLTAVVGNLTLMRTREGNDALLLEHMDEIEGAAKRGAGLTRRLLAFARRQMVEPQVLDPVHSITELERLLRRLLPAHVALTLDLPAGLWSVRADPSALEQILVNLTVNASDAMPNGGTLRVVGRNATVGNASIEGFPVPAGDWFLLDVSDSGTGIDDAVLTHIFEPFFTTKEGSGGSGLGLATVYGTVTQAGGRIFVRSALGRGTTFSIFLPRVNEPAKPVGPTPLRDVPRALPGETVLLIEDEASVREVVQKLLERLGYAVLTAVDGLQGVSAALGHEGRLDVIISDLMMPGLGGREAVARILEARPGIPVLFISGYSEDALRWNEGAPRSGKLLQKPFSVQDLAAAVRYAIGR